ncbi:sperm antigen with calponin homology and coiled-coil domains split discs isoform X1 [Rhynchophorus ferrugineus]|uniref:sperm antigen with calponin homology and coiled-coil domains split discs isoform X1 n=1 Tax=Rhynchophorus ferrugineus TaxID=354439 RepID=UPI003FCC2A13
MGFLDNLLLTKKENTKGQRVDRNRPSPTNANRNPPRTLPPQHPPSIRPPRPQPSPLPATSSFFGSLKRLKAGVSGAATKKKPPTENGKSKRGGAVASEIKSDGKKGSGKKIVKGSVERAEEAIECTTQTDAVRRQEIKSTDLPWDHFVTRRPPRPASQQTKPKRPVTVSTSTNLAVRRGHKEGQVHSDNISRTSSVTNLDSLESNYQGQGGKGAKPRKAASKEIIDKASHDAKKGINKNNNKVEPPPQTGVQPLSCSSDSLQETELQQLRKQIREMAEEKSSLALQLGEQKGQLNVLQKEIQKLKLFQEESNLEIEKLSEENTALRNRLRDVAHSPLSDNEKQQLLFESRHHSSAPASIATNVIDDNGGEATTCTTPDWDKHSSGNVSEVSVACLQDKINQMQETHYSTNEELQATLQELTDLQRQLTELQQENERLNEEKSLMFDSLCRQTERLNDSRGEVEGLKQLLFRERNDDNSVNEFESVVEREQRMVELLKSTQEERESLLVKLEQVQAELHESRAGNVEKVGDIAQLTERVKTLECSLDAKNAEHKQLDQELIQAKDQCSGKQIEINRLTDLLENARTKINELEQDRALSDKSELDELLDNARKEKDQLESEVAYLKEQLARSKNEIEKLKEQVFILQEECKVTRNNAKTTQSDLEYKCDKLVVEKNNLSEQLQHFQEAVNELQVQVQCHLEDKRQLSAVLSETQRNLSEAERRNLNLESDIEELKKLRAEENEEWEKFQSDLLTSVRVANDFKTEAQQESQKIILENKAYRDKVRLLESQLEKLKGEKSTTGTQTNILLSPQIVSIVKNIDPTLTNRLSCENISSANENMDKLFPILQRSKSRDTLNETKISRGRSREKLDGKHKRDMKSKDKHTTEKESIRKNKSSGNLAEIDGIDPLTIRKVPIKSLTKSHSRDPKMKSPNDSSDFKYPIKKRIKNETTNSKYQIHRKTVSAEEETLLKSLDDWYRRIDQNIPEEFLSTEDKAVKKLKLIFEDEGLRDKPMAKKPKEQLAISKPLMNSVVLNPRLEEIIRNPNLPTVDNQIIRESALEEVCSIRNEEYDPSRYVTEVDSNSKLHKSKSVDDLNIFEEDRTDSELAPVLYRVDKTNNLHNQKLYKVRISTDIHPNDSVSNPRYSSKYFEHFHSSEKRTSNIPKPDININYENLDDILASIQTNTPFEKLTKEQQFAFKLKRSLDEAERKSTLKRIHKRKLKALKSLDISGPTVESVEKNWKLKEILLNPQVKSVNDLSRSIFYVDNVRHSTDISSDIGNRGDTLKNISTLQTSKSYDDISFAFIPENTLFNLYLNEKAKNHTFKTFKDSETTSSSFTSAEFNLVTGNINLSTKKYNIASETKLCEDLLYNDTFSKMKKKTKSGPSHACSLPNLLDNKLTKHQELEEKDPKIVEVSQKYQNDLKALVKNIEIQELRKSLRKPKHKVGEKTIEHHTPVVKPFDIEEHNQSTEELFNKEKEVSFSPGFKTVSIEDIPVSQKNSKMISFTTKNVDEKDVKPHLPVHIDTNGSEMNSVLELDSSYITNKLLHDIPNNIKQNTLEVNENWQYPIVSADGNPTDDQIIIKSNSEFNSVVINHIQDTKAQQQPLRKVDENIGFTPDNKNNFKLIETIDTDSASVSRLNTSVINQNEKQIKKDKANFNEKIEVPYDSNNLFNDDMHIYENIDVLMDQVINNRIERIKSGNLKQYFTENSDINQFSNDTMTKYENADSILSQGRTLKSNDLKEDQLLSTFSTYSKKSDNSVTEVSYLLSSEFRPTGNITRQSNYSGVEITEIEDTEPVNDIEKMKSHDTFNSSAKESNFEFVDDSEPTIMSPSATPPPPPPEFISYPENDNDFYEFPPLPPNLSDLSTNTRDHNSTLKENRYGVVSPIKLRHTYRTVVKEYKDKFPQENEELPPEDSSSESDIEYQENFIDDFFKPVQPSFYESTISNNEEDETPNTIKKDDNDSDIVLRKSETRLEQIDNEMQEIMEKYLHTRTSLILKKTGVDQNEPSTNLKKYDNFENLQDIDSKFKKRHVKIAEDENNGILSPEEVSFIEQMKKKYGCSESNTGISTVTVNKKSHSFTEEELKLLDSIKEGRNTRPLSDLNETDWNLIEGVCKQYENKVELNRDSIKEDSAVAHIINSSSTPKCFENTFSEQHKQGFDESKLEKCSVITDYNDDHSTRQNFYNVNSITMETENNILPEIQKEFENDNITYKTCFENDYHLTRHTSNKYTPKHQNTTINITEHKNKILPEMTPNEEIKHSSSVIDYSNYHLLRQSANNIDSISMEDKYISLPSISTTLKVDENVNDIAYGNATILNRTSFEKKSVTVTSSNDHHLSPKNSSNIKVTTVEEKHNTVPTSLSVPTRKSFENVVLRKNKGFGNLTVDSQQDNRNSKRLSDLIFTETIIIPHSKNERSSPPLPLGNLERKTTLKSELKSSHQILKTLGTHFDDSSVKPVESNTSFKKAVIKNDSTEESSENNNVQESIQENKNLRETIFIPKLTSFNSNSTTNLIKNISPDSPPLNSSVNKSQGGIFKEIIFIGNNSESPRQISYNKKPLPMPRSKESKEPISATTSRQSDSSISKLQTFNVIMKSDENFSEKRLQAENNLDSFMTAKYKSLKEPENKFQEDIKYKQEKHLILEYNERRQSTDVMEPMETIPKKNQPSEVNSSQTTITVSTKVEQLDLTNTAPVTPLNDTEIEEISRHSLINASNMNLFTMDSNSSYESYADLFKSKESKDFEALIGKKKKGFTLMAEYTSDSFSSASYMDDQGAQGAPKVVDFIPMDDNTTPYFTKPNISANYDTLEREKTFQILGTASKLSQKSNQEDDEQNSKCELESSMEALLKKSSSSHTQIKSNRTSFNQAKKLFEALAETKKEERPKTMGEKRIVRTSVRDSRSFDHIQPMLDLGKPKK